jgi:hypothetical protein
MPDPAELFRISDDGTGAGTSPHSRVEGDTPSAQRGIIGFSFKDSSGDVVLPQLDTTGRLPVTFDGSQGVNLKAHGELAAGSLTLVDVTNAVITLTASTKYDNIAWNVCSRQDSLFQLVWDDNGAETILDEVIVGSGSYSAGSSLNGILEFTSGATGTQELKIVAKNFQNPLSSLRGTIVAQEGENA